MDRSGVNQLPILQVIDLVGILNQDWVMGCHQDRDPFLLNQVAEQDRNLAGSAAVQLTGWLVGQNEIRPGRYGQSNGQTLLLPARHLRRAVTHPIGQTDDIQAAPGTLGAILAAQAIHPQ